MPTVSLESMNTAGLFPISWRGRAAMGLFVVNTALLPFPPIPPYVKGSVWSYALKTLVIVLAALEAHRLAEPIARRWESLRPRARWMVGLGSAVGALLVALGLRAVAPTLFGRASAEVGPWETISTACFAAALVLIWRASALADDGARRHARLIAACFGVLLLEETDYAGIVGAFIGRVEGVYVGSLHDLINLAASGHLHPAVLGAVAAAAAGGVIALWRGDWLQPRRVARTLVSEDGAWLALGLGGLLFAGLGEAGLLGRLFADPSAEEAIEMAGSLCLAAFALQTAAKVLPIEWGPAAVRAAPRDAAPPAEPRELATRP